MNSIPCANESPRVCEKGYIHWYEGDTFELTFDITFVDDTGSIVEIQPTDEITICFRDKYQNILCEFKTIGSNEITMNFDKEITSKFKVGEYTYCARLNNGWIKTFMRNNIILVE